MSKSDSKIAELKSYLAGKAALERLMVTDPHQLPIEQTPFWVIDVETTGDRGGQDRIIEIAAIKVMDLELQRVIQTQVNPGRPISAFTRNLTGITDEMLVGAPEPKEVYPWLFSHLKRGVFVAHRVSFDRSFVDQEATLLGIKPLDIPSLCTVRLSRRLVFDLPGYSLDQIAWYFGLEFGDDSSPSRRHRALGDAWVAAKAFLCLLQLAQKTGIHTFGELKELESMPVRKARNFWRV
jgi:DNA polymerase III epsilon subunit family exonuclease